MEERITGDCVTSHYLVKDRPIDVRFDRKPLLASATWCSRHDQWISSCSYLWQEKAKALELQNQELQNAQALHTKLFIEQVDSLKRDIENAIRQRDCAYEKVDAALLQLKQVQISREEIFQESYAGQLEIVRLKTELREKDRLFDEMKRRLSQAVNSRCSCGGMGPGACGCDYCALYHFVLNNVVVEKPVICPLCGDDVPDDFKERKTGWCEDCDRQFHARCWAEHNRKEHSTEKRVDPSPKEWHCAKCGKPMQFRDGMCMDCFGGDPGQ